jgi:membrane protease YdiL (CAAX protease family)
MNALLDQWHRLPVIVRAVSVGLLISVCGTIPWPILVASNLKLSPSVPWAVLVMAAYLWLFWRYLRGRGWPEATSEARQRDLRGGPLSGRIWAWSLLAGILAFGALIALSFTLDRLVRFPQAQPEDLSRYSPLTVLCLLTMSAWVAGIVEEAAFRGYMQRPIEQRYGLPVAILVTGTFFGLAHVGHGSMYALARLPLFLLSSTVFGVLAHETGSIRPGIVLHAGLDFIPIIAWLRGMPAQDDSFRLTGTDHRFWAIGLAGIGLGLFAVFAFLKLASLTRSESVLTR